MKVHEHRIHVRYAETDQMGVVYHANYLVYMEEGRTRMLADLGFPYHELERRGWRLAVRKVDVRYRAGATYGDEVVVRTRVAGVRGASVTFAYELSRGADGACLATGSTELACLEERPEGRRPAHLPADVRDVLVAAAG